jgi:hypothetical protein
MRITMSHHARTAAYKTRFLLAAMLLLAVALPLRAEDKKPASSLNLIPADAAFYKAMLRNREQVEAVGKSKTWARLTKLPLYQLGLAALKQQYAGPQLADFREWLEQEENRDLAAMLTDAVSDDLFCYAGKNWVDFMDLLQEMSNAFRFGQVGQFLKDPNFKDQKGMVYSQFRAVLRALARNPEKIKFPDLVFGFKIKDAKKAEAQVARLETILQALAGLQPMLQDRVKRAKVGDDSFLTLSFDGGMIPWDEIDWKDIEEAAGEFDGVRKNLKKLKLTLSLGVRHGFLLFALGSSTEGVAQFGGAGPRLTSRSELKPLMRAADKRLTNVSYSSKALAALSTLDKEDIDGLAVLAGQFLDAVGVAEEQRKAVMKDVSRLGDDLKKNVTAPGASLSFSYLSPRGYEGYEYEYGEFPDVDSSKSLSLLDHVGGDPILATVGRSKGTVESYQTASKWIQVAYGHAEPIVLQRIDEEYKKKYQEISKIVIPLLKRFDAVTAKMLLPSLADGQAGFVLDGKWKSKQWQAALPTSDKELPMLEMALLVGVSDRDLLEKAMKSYGKLIDDALIKTKENAPPDFQLPFTKLPQPEVKDGKSGKLYLWRLPKQLQLDPRVVVTAGLSDKVGVLAFSAEHAERLLARQPLKVEGGPLADGKRPLSGAAYFNWPGFLDALSPWMLFAIDQAHLEQVLPGGNADDKDAQKKQRETIVQHVRAVLNALKAIRVSTSATYLENGALITHSEAVIRGE